MYVSVKLKGKSCLSCLLEISTVFFIIGKFLVCSRSLGSGVGLNEAI